MAKIYMKDIYISIFIWIILFSQDIWIIQSKVVLKERKLFYSGYFVFEKLIYWVIRNLLCYGKFFS
jgi:hypothetical protein